MKTLTKLLSTVAVTAALFATAANAAVKIDNWSGDPTTSIGVTFSDGGVGGIGSASTPLTAFYNNDVSSIFFGQYMGSASHTSSHVGSVYSFDDTFTFALPTGYLSGAGISNFSSRGVNLVFDHVTFQLANLDAGITNPATGARQFQVGDTTITLLGNQTLRVQGHGSRLATYSGNLTFTPPVIPEPATWGLMIMGFGGAGAMLRSKRRTLALG